MHRGFKTTALFLAMGLVATPLTAAYGSPEREPRLARSAVDAPAPHNKDDGKAGDQSDRVPINQRDKILGPGWRTDNDVAWTTTGDASGFHVYAAQAREGYRWDQVATLAVEGFDTDRWVGNACLAGDGYTVAAVYAPRGFTNDESLFLHGGFAALVDLRSGAVTALGTGYALSYFNPGCGADDQVTLSQFSVGETRLVTVRVANPEKQKIVKIKGQFTSATPAKDGLIAAASGQLIAVSDDGDLEQIARTKATPSDLVLTSDGALTYLDRDAGQTEVYRIDQVETAKAPTPKLVASGKLSAVGIARANKARVYVTGKVHREKGSLPAGLKMAGEASPRSTFSADGELAIQSTFIPKPVPSSDGGTTVQINATVLQTEEDVTFKTDGHRGDVTRHVTLPDGGEPRHGRAGFGSGRPGTLALTEDPHSPVSTGSTCAIARNLPTVQALQPNSTEVEWAVDQAVRGNLGAQSTFPLPALSGGGRVPAQVLLGILAQESNFWQASRYVVPGVTGNPLVGNYFGTDRSSSSPDAWWQVDYEHADCGYGIAQVTDGMRIGDMPASQQLIIATDYQANIARGLQILIEKWNQTYDAGLMINDGNPAYLENWFYAIWAYNSGFHPRLLGGEVPWGVGWLNNPVNPQYPPTRGSFLNHSPNDAANPQLWPYPERVMGFAAHSAYFLQSVSQGDLGDTFNYGTAFSPSWWRSADGSGGDFYRELVKPPVTLFCDETNECNADSPHMIPVSNYSSACQRDDLQCWYHEPAEWKKDCDIACGYESVTYSLDAAKPPSSNSYPPNCSAAGLPSGALIIDNVPTGTPVSRGGCTPVASVGTFEFTFPPEPDGDYPGKVDMHQLGAGFNGHFYFSHTRIPGTDAAFGGALDVSGEWRLDQALSGWACVYVHMPSHGAWTQQAVYKIDTGNGVVQRSVNQRNYADTWVSLGTLQFSGIPTVTLDNHSARYSSDKRAQALSGTDDIAWDAIAFAPRPKPDEFVVALGDSYSSGEGTSAFSGVDFFRGSDHSGTDPIQQNACHRSPFAWPFKIDLPSVSGEDSIRDLLTRSTSPVDFQMMACSGAITTNVLPRSSPGAEQQYGEANQLDRGFVDANTTLVTLSVGGNDIGFGPVVQACITHPLATDCEHLTAPAEFNFDGTLGEAVDAQLAALPAKVENVLGTIHQKAPNAKVLLMGYPDIFADGVNCVMMSAVNTPWLRSVAAKLNRALTKAASSAGTFVTYANPVYSFAGHNVCADDHAITRLVLTATPGDAVRYITVPGENSEPQTLGLSAQTLHPNARGTDFYAAAANDALRSTKTAVSGTLTAGAPTTYYATLRWMEGPTAMNVTSFSPCGSELRIGLRSGAPGTQDTESLSWSAPHDMQNFMWNATSPSTADIPPDSYAFNARMTTACTGGANQSWEGQIYR